jgi:two-component system cell cycle response regulator DivK
MSTFRNQPAPPKFMRKAGLADRVEQTGFGSGGFLKITVLLVEDSKFQKLMNERMLHKAGYTVLNAADGEEALRLAREKIPDIVLLDMLLPKLGGREVIHALRADASTARIPVLVFSGLSQANELKLTEEGAAGYFSKSRLAENPEAGEKELFHLIERLVQRSKNPDKVEAKSEAKTAPLKAAAKAT